MPELLERDRELACLHRLVDAAAAGTGGLVVIEGDAGIGKTCLVRSAAGLADAAGVRVLRARGAELEGELAFGVVRELLAPAAVRRSLDGVAALALPVLTCADPETGQNLFATLHGLYWLVADLADDGPILIVLDDAHWCDPPSLRFLAYLARRLDGLAVSLLVAHRPAVHASSGELLAALGAEPDAETIRPDPLGAGAVRSLVTAELGEPDEPLVAACRTATGGNPFLLGELLAEMTALGIAPRADEVARVAGIVPREVERSVRLRLARMGPAATALARAAAVLSDGTRLGRVAALAGIADEESIAAADALVGARLTERASTVTFVHPLVRSAVAATMGPAELSVAHQRAAALLADDGETGDSQVPHLLAARPAGDAGVVSALRAAAARASGRGAPDVGARYLRRALAEPAPAGDRPGLLVELGICAMWAGEADALDALTAATEQALDPEGRAYAALLLARQLFEYGRIPEAVQVCEGAIDDLAGRAPELALELEAELLTGAMQDLRTRPIGRRRQAQRGHDPEPAGAVECMLLASMAVEEMLLTRSRDRALHLAELALTGGHLIDERTLVTLPSALITLCVAGRPDRATEVWDVVLERRRIGGNQPAAALASAFRGFAVHLSGDVPAAVSDLTFAVDLAREVESLIIVLYGTAWLGSVLVDAGELDEAESRIAGCRPLMAGSLFAANYLLSARGRLRVAQGRYDEAVEDLRDCGQRLDAWGTKDPAPCPWRATLTLALLGTGDHAAARREGAEAVRAARAWGAPHALSDALLAAGVAEPGRAGLELLEEAAAVAAPLHRARALVELGASRRRRGERVAARPPLRDGLELAVSCGAVGLVRRAHDELVATGARPRRLPTSGADALTPTERRVTAMVAGGKTNRAVAQALFVSQKTVETHLGHAYRKLGITTRTQLAAALGADPGSVS